ncbi:MAG: hypothetical protein KC516_02960 [Nanoarchaeota archaeon]|nr:hypothetical protein [Nanoarchaeota archaeon]
MNKRVLSFYGTVGNSEETILTIDREGFLDLSYLFRDFFATMGDVYGKWSKSRWEINDKIAIAKFNFEEEFLRNLLGRYSPDELAGFLEEHVSDIQDFHNETLIKKIRNFEKNYEKLEYSYLLRKHIIFLPNGTNNKEISEKVGRIEKLCGDPKSIKKLSWEERMSYKTLETEKKDKFSFGEDERIFTGPYPAKSLPFLAKKLKEESGRSFFIVNRYFSGPDLDYFSIIRNCRDLPLNHLKLVEK